MLRFPGGNMLEGDTNGTYWDWKDTLGPLKDRPGFPGVWGYQQTHGLGIVEYLEWAEDMNLEVGKRLLPPIPSPADLHPQSSASGPASPSTATSLSPMTSSPS